MEWTKYTTKEALKDNDELMILDTDGKANKRTLMDKIWDYVVDKMTTAAIAKLETTNKTLIGAVNELNSNATSDKALLHGIGSNTWVEIVTFSYTTWNISSLLVAFGEDIYSVKYGVDASRNYIDRCDAVNMNKQNAGMKVGFKVSNNVLHIYIKVERSVQLLQIQILAYYSENEPYVFSPKISTLTDSDMDKIC